MDSSERVRTRDSFPYSHIKKTLTVFALDGGSMKHPRCAELFDQALDVSESERMAWLTAACAGDAALYAEVTRLLRVDARSGDFLKNPFFEPANSTVTGRTRNPVPESFGAYKVLRQIGVGGMGEVWLAQRQDGQFDQHVAIKQVAYPTTDLLQRFRRERQILARLEHPNIARLIDGGEDAYGVPYLVMEYVEGEPLLKWCDAHKLGISQRVELFLSVCAAVQYAHRNLIVHRDLKPRNILINADGEVKLLDFGIAKLLHEQPSDGERTGARFKMLTPDYAAPEQINDGAITTATDVYQLGLVLYELLCGCRALRPGRADTEAAKLRTPLRLSSAPFAPDGLCASIAAARDTNPSALRKMLRGDLERVTHMAIREESNQRYENAGDLAQDLRHYLRREPVLATHPSLRYRVGKFIVRNRWGVAMGLLALIASLGGAAGIAWQVERAREEAKAATQTKNYLVEMLHLSDPTNSGVMSGSEVLAEASRQIENLPKDSALRLDLANELVLIYNGKGQTQQATQLVETELGSPPDVGRVADAVHLRLFLGWVWAQVDASSPEKLQTLLQETIDRYPDQKALELADALSVLARVKIDQGQYDSAETSSRRALSILGTRVPSSDGRVLNARIDLAFALSAKRDWRASREQSERALADVPPGDTRARVHVLAIAAPRRALFGEFASAETLYAQIEAIDQRTKFRTGFAYLHILSHAENGIDLNQPQLIQQQLRELAELASTQSLPQFAQNDQSPWLRGELALLARDYAGAVEIFAAGHSDTTVPDSPDVRRSHLYLGALEVVALTQAERIDEARHRFERLFSPPVLPTTESSYATAMAYAAKGVLSEAQSLHEQAVDAFDRAMLELQNAKSQPAGLEEQLKENRDAVRIRAWKVRAQYAAGRISDAQQTFIDAHRLGLGTLGAGHPFMLELEHVRQQGESRIAKKNLSRAK